MMKKKSIPFIIVIILIGIFLASQKQQENIIESNQGNIFSSTTIYENGWSAPIKTEFSDSGWEDSYYISRNGNTIYFFYHPGSDLITNLKGAMQIQLDGRMYYSNYPFIEKHLLAPSNDDFVTEAGPYISQSGDLYYHRNFPPGNEPEKIVKGEKTLDLGTGNKETNPHYCDRLDELYFDAGDQDILVYKDGKATMLPEPINIPDKQDFQPFLTDDCQTMYFTSNRDSDFGIPAIYKSHRLGELEWSKPELFITNPDGVGEFSMSSDGKRLAFVQISRTNSGGYNADLFYSENKKN